MAAGRELLLEAFAVLEQTVATGTHQRRRRRYLLTRFGELRFLRWQMRTERGYGYPLDEALGLTPGDPCSAWCARPRPGWPRLTPPPGDGRKLTPSQPSPLNPPFRCLPASAGASHRHPFNRRGNRQLNAAMHRIAVTQLRIHEPAKDYVDKKRSEGMSKTEAIRALKRCLSRVVFKTMTSMNQPTDRLTAVAA